MLTYRKYPKRYVILRKKKRKYFDTNNREDDYEKTERTGTAR